jgi:hypothetical protein
MKPKEIIRKAASDIGIDPDYAEHGARDVLTKGMKHDQMNDTLMFYKFLGKKSAFVHFVTADSPLSLLAALHHFLTELRKLGVDFVYSNTKNPTILHALQNIGVNFQPSKDPEYPLQASLK